MRHATAKSAAESPSRIVHVIDSLRRSGGAEMQLIQNLRHFDPMRFSHEVVLLRSPTDSRIEDVPKHVPIVFLQETQRARRLIAIARLRRFLMVDRPALVHGTLPFASLAGRLAT